MEIRFADQRLTVLTEDFKATTNRRRRRAILREALPLCRNVPDVRMFHTSILPDDSLQGIICERWDEIVRSQIESVPFWTTEMCHYFYALSRSGSAPEQLVAIVWRALCGPKAA